MSVKVLSTINIEPKTVSALIPVSITPIIGKSSSELIIVKACSRVTVLNSPGFTVVKTEFVTLSTISKFSTISTLFIL